MKVLSVLICKVEVVDSLSRPGILGELKIKEGELFAWIPDEGQIPPVEAWVSLSVGGGGSIDGGIIT